MTPPSPSILFSNLSNFFYYSRYEAACRPNVFRVNLKLQNANPKVFKYLLTIIICSILINLPRFLETELKWKSTNVTSDDSFKTETKLIFKVSALRKDPHYIRQALSYFKPFSLIQFSISWMGYLPTDSKNCIKSCLK